MMRHAGLEYGVLLDGRLTLRIDFEKYDLEPGDSFCFDSMRPHLYKNHTDEVAEGVWFVVDRSPTGVDDTAGSGGMRSAVDVLDAMSRLPGRTES